MSPSARRPAQDLAQRQSKSRKGAGARTKPKQTQRERLLEAIIELSAKEGYQGVSIAQVSSHARVSSATFYEQFDGKEDCLLAAYRSVAKGMFDQMDIAAPDGSNWKRPARNALSSLMSALRADPDRGRLLFVEAAAGGPLIGEERRRVLGQFERLAQAFIDSMPADGERLDVPATALVGSMRSIIARRLRTNAEDELPDLVDDMVGWLASYAIEPGVTPWSTSPNAVLPSSHEQAPKPDGHERRRLPRGRHGLPAGVVARSQRTRIIYATADVTMRKGYANTTVADIVSQAGVARDVFYEHFTDKQHAFLEAQQHPTQHIVDACAAAYFSAEDWPERVWNGLATLLELIAENPAISHLRLIECYAAGPVAIRRAEEITRSFTIFLEEGYSYRPDVPKPPRLTSEAITGAAFEIIQRQAAIDDFAGLMPRLPQITYIAIAPFLGPEEAVQRIEELSARKAAAEAA